MTRSPHSPRGPDVRPAAGTDRGLSQIVSVILLIAVAVVLIGGVAGFMFGIFGNLGSGAPQAQFSFQWDGSAAGGEGQLMISMVGGPSLTQDNAQELRVVDQESGNTYTWGDTGNNAETNDNNAGTFDEEGGDGQITAGDAVTMEGIDADGDGTIANGAQESFEPGETIAVVWVGENAQSTQVLATFTIPS